MPPGGAGFHCGVRLRRLPGGGAHPLHAAWDLRRNTHGHHDAGDGRPGRHPGHPGHGPGGLQDHPHHRYVGQRL